MRRFGKGFSGVETPLFEGMLAARQLAEEGIAEEQVQADDVVAAAVQENVAEDNLEHDKVAQKLEIIKLKARDADIAKTEGRHAAEQANKQAEIYHLDLDHSFKVLNTHNVVAILEKSDAAEGFEQIIDFLSGSYIHYALTVNLHIYISCIKQFWTLLLLNIQMTSLDDAEGVVCLQNEEIFAGLAQMGYEKPSTKLTFYKAFFSSQWKFLIYTLLQSLSAKRTSWNEFSTAMASAAICLSIGQKFNFSKYIFDSLVHNVDISSKFYMVETPLFEGILAARQLAEEGIAEEQVQADDAVAAAVQENVAEDVANDDIPSPASHDIPSPSQEQSLPPQQP
nr:hypothetical protein [Tanacetum cinerariifolium]